MTVTMIRTVFALISRVEEGRKHGYSRANSFILKSQICRFQYTPLVTVQAAIFDWLLHRRKILFALVQLWSDGDLLHKMTIIHSRNSNISVSYVVTLRTTKT